MLSPAIDFAKARGGQNPLASAIALPTLTAAAIEKATGKDIDPAQLAEVERYALTEYTNDLLRGVNDRAAVERMSEKVARFTGLDAALVRQWRGRIDEGAFRRELWRDEGKIGGVDDVMISAYDTGEDGPEAHAGSAGPVAIADYIANVLKWKVDAPYREHIAHAGIGWDWNSDDFRTPGLDATGDLRDMLAANADLEVLVAHGATDLNTLYMGSKLIVDQIPDFGGDHRLRFKVYPGGHGFYRSREASGRALHDDARAMYERRSK
jgi:carboxypeptidase C (cathepsin A)